MGDDMKLALNIPDEYDVTRHRKGGDFAEAWLRRPTKSRECPRCGARGHVNGHRPRAVFHLPVQDRPLVLHLDVAQTRCPRCGRCWHDAHAIVSEASPHITRDLEAAILRHIMTRHTVTDASRRYGVSPHICERVLDAALIGHGYLPEWLRVDGSEANTPEGRFATAVVDGGSGCLAEILPGKRAEHLDEFFGRFDARDRARVRWYCCDMCDAYISAARRWLPNAVVCIDRFHVVKRVTKAVGDVRRRLQGDERVTKTQAKLLRSCWKPMLMRRADVEAIDDGYAAELAERRARFESTLVWDGDLNELPNMRPREPMCRRLDRAPAPDEGLGLAYDLLQAFHAWSDGPWTRRERDGLRRWVALAKSSGVPETGAAADTIWAYREGIPDGYRHNRTNAQAEGTNNAIKVIKRMSYGFRDFDRMRRRLMLTLGYHEIIEAHVTLRDVARGQGLSRGPREERDALAEGRAAAQEGGGVAG